jgi:hypothetical protein
MIANSEELKIAVRNLKIMEEALRALRDQLEASNPRLLDMTSKAYMQRIASLQKDITAYLAEHPTEVSLILPPLELAIASSTPTLPHST